MRKAIVLLAVACLLGMTGSAIAAADSTPIKGATVKGGKNPGGNYPPQTVVRPATPGDPAAPQAAKNISPTSGVGIVVKPNKHAINTKGTGTEKRTHLTNLKWTPEKAAAKNVNPNTGIGIVVKKNPGSSRARVAAGAPIRGTTISGGRCCCPPDSGKICPRGASATAAKNVSPTTGIGIVVKKNPGSSRARVAHPSCSNPQQRGTFPKGCVLRPGRPPSQ